MLNGVVRAICNSEPLSFMNDESIYINNKTSEPNRYSHIVIFILCITTPVQNTDFKCELVCDLRPTAIGAKSQTRTHLWSLSYPILF